jgi:hypothetical protein
MPSLAEVGVRNRLAEGDKLWKATFDTAQACAFVWSWAYTTRKLGRAPTQIEHAAEWKCGERTVKRDMARFRKVYGEDAEVQAVADWLNATAEAWLDERTKALAMPAPDWLAGVAVT